MGWWREHNITIKMQFYEVEKNLIADIEKLINDDDRMRELMFGSESENKHFEDIKPGSGQYCINVFGMHGAEQSDMDDILMKITKAFPFVRIEYYYHDDYMGDEPPCLTKYFVGDRFEYEAVVTYKFVGGKNGEPACFRRKGRKND